MNLVKCWMVVDVENQIRGVFTQEHSAESEAWNMDNILPEYKPHRIIAGHFVPEEEKKEEGK